jgi:hypothetical protein
MPHESARFSEALDGEGDLALLLMVVLVGGLFVFVGGAVALTMDPLPVRAFGVLIAVAPTVAILLSHRTPRVEVRNDGVHYWNGLVFRHGHVPASEVADVTWTDGDAYNSDVFTREEWDEFKARRREAVMENARESGTWFVPQRSPMKVVRHGARAIKGHGGSSVPRALDKQTEAVVRIDDTQGNIYLFATDHPEEFTHAVERVSEVAQAGESGHGDADPPTATA